MTNRISRRDWLKLIGGSALGMMLTPIPWKLLDDSAKWTQNWSWTPVPPNGKTSYKYTTCSLCRAACGVRVRCVGGRPVSLTGVPNHPVNDGSLCAMGLAGHILRYHPARLLQPYKRAQEVGGTRMVPISMEEAISDLSKSIAFGGPGSVAILDMQPKRMLSYVYRKFLAGLGNSVYMIPEISDGITANLTGSVLRTGDLTFGYDIENARTILSFGSPVLDGWGTLGQFSGISKARCWAPNERLKIIQVETAHSRTAQLADEWVPVRPGTEAVFALGLANVMISEKLCDLAKLAEHSGDFHNRSGHSFVDLVRGYSPSEVSGKTGVSAERITRIASELASRKPSVIMFGGNSAAGPFSFVEQLAFMGLNILVGAVGAKGGLAAPRELPGPFEKHVRLAAETLLADVPDHSIGLLIIDGADSGDALPWTAIRRKLRTQSPVVVSLSSHLAGAARHADYLLPSPAYMEAAGDSPTPASSSSASYSISEPIASAPAQAIQPLDFVRRLDAAIHTHPDPVLRSMGMKQLLRTRIERIHSEQRGKVFDAASGKSTKLSAVSLTTFAEILEHGGCWFDDEPARISSAHYSFLGGADSNFEQLAAIADRAPGDGKLILLPLGTRGIGTIAQENSMMSKLYRESDLRTPADTVSVNPETARRNGFADGARATVRTESGSVNAKVRFDPAIMPGVLEAPVGPPPGSFDRVEARYENNVLDICRIESDSTWRMTTAEIFPS